MIRGISRAAAALLISFFAATAWAQRPQIIVPHAGPALRLADRAFESEGTAVRFNAEKLLALRYLDEAEFTLPNATRHTYVFELAQSHGGGVHSWIGRHKELGSLHRAIVTTGPGGSFGVISTPDGEFRLVPGEGHDWLMDMTVEQLHLPIIDLRNDIRVPPAGAKRGPDDQAPSAFYAIPGVNTVGLPKVTPTPQVFVDIMFVVTQGLANSLGGNLMTRLNFLVTRANTSYTDSEVAITLRLVNVTVVDFPDSGDNDVALYSITPDCTVVNPSCDGNAFNAAVFGNIETLRNTHRADMVALMRNGSAFGGSGIAWIGSSSPNSRFMYSVTTGCVQGCESVFIHELGHNMGNHHDRATSAWQAGGTAAYSGASGNSFGYAYCSGVTLTCNPQSPPASGGCAAGTQPECLGGNNGINFSDLMAYFQGSTLRNYKFSNPNVTCVGSGVGAPALACGIGGSGGSSADTASSMNTNRIPLSGLKAAVVTGASPGSLQFTASAFSGTEAGGTVDLTVSRVGGSSGGVQVSYATADGSALAGVDYTATSGTLTWVNGDATDKTISVPIANDGATEAGESFTVTLSNPTGEAGIFLGIPSTATAMIIEPWPPGNVMPAGFTMPAGSSGAWTVVATDAANPAYEGTHSLRSAQLYGTLSPLVYTPSDVEFTGDFAAGTLGFAYRVSSYPSFGLFEFSVDGTVVLSNSGESGWVFFTRAITAGTHTLRWTFRNALPFPCNVASPPAPGGAACADRAWIDALVLPMATTASTTSLLSSANPATVGQSVTFTASVSGSAGTATGTVQFRDGASPIPGCSAVALAAGSAACLTSSLAAGTHSITAAYSGNLTYSPSTSSAVSQVIIDTVALTISKTGTGTGAVTSAPAGINCGATCTADVAVGTPITLTATPTAGSVFTGWSGGGCGGVGTCQVTPSSATTVTANFALLAGVPTPGASPSSFDFGGQSMQTTTPSQSVSVINVGTGTLTITSISVDNPQYSQTNNCTTLATGANCTVILTFTPTAQGTVTGTLTIQTSGGTVTVSLTGVGELSLVTHYYRAILNRAPDGPGKTFWEGEAVRLQGLGADVNETWFVMAGYFFNSPEYLAAGKTNPQFVTDLYNTFFNRAPDSGGQNFWSNQIAGGLPREVVLFSFMFSTEFRTFTTGIFGSTAARPEVNLVMDLFRGILNRLPDNGAFNYWVGQMRAAQCQGAGAVYAEVHRASNFFIYSAEYSGRGRNNTQVVTDMYYSFLRRGGDLSGVQFWVNELNTGARNLEGVRQGFVASPEFGARVAAVIAAGCMP